MTESIYFDDEQEERKTYLIKKFKGILKKSELVDSESVESGLDRIENKKIQTGEEKNLLNYYSGLIDKSNLIDSILEN